MTSTLRRIAARLASVFAPRRHEREMAREINAHLSLLEDAFLERGATEAEARRQARLAMGGPEQAKELHRDARTLTWLDDLQRDVRYAARSLARTPGFTAVTVFTLALGIGATTAIFSVVHAVMLAPPPYGNPEQLARLYEHVPGTELRDGKPRRFSGVNGAELAAAQKHATTVSYISGAGLGFALVSVVGTDDGAQRQLTLVPSDLFSMYGVSPVVGRWFTKDDERDGDNKVIILSYDEWVRDFSGDPGAIGRTMTFNGNTFSQGVELGAKYTIVGVMPERFSLDDGSQLWAPARVASDNRRQRLGTIARLADGVTSEAAAAEIGALVLAARGTEPGAGGTAGASWPDGAGPPGRARFEFIPIQDEVGESVKPALLVLTGAVCIVLLIACANVANLMLARTTSRAREIAVRVALGAGRGRLIRQFLTESALLAIAGGAGGAALAAAGVRAFRSLATTLHRIDLGANGNTFPRLSAVTISVPVLIFAAAISIATGVACGLGAALRGVRDERLDVLHSAASGASAARSRTQSFLVVAEVAMAMLLSVGAGLLVRSFLNLVHVDTGFNPAGVLTFQVALPGRTQPLSEQRAFADDVVAQLRSAPGVLSVGFANQLPLVALENSTTLRFTPAPPAIGQPPSGAGADVRLVSSGFLQAIGVRLVDGRLFNPGDGATSPRVLLVNRAFARKSFSDRPAVGTIVYTGRDTVPWEIVGVVDDVRQSKLGMPPAPQFFAVLDQWASPSVPVFPLGAYYAVRTTSQPLRLLPAVRQVVGRLNTQAVLENVVTMDDVVSNAASQPRLYAVLLGTFSTLAVLLAAAGIYGVMAYRVAERTREIGIRMALGAERAQVLALVLRQSALLTCAGTVLGVAGAAATTKSLQSLLFGLEPLDASTFAGVAVLFMAIATLASYIPARRAATVDPLTALRAE